jgi:AcrR family transcriptional regulator
LLINAVLVAWEHGGGAAISARSLCAATGVQISSIYHHFGSVEQLLVSAQEHAAGLARDWCRQQLESLGDARLPPEALGALLSGLIDDWCHDRRRIAFAWRECRLSAIKHPAFVPPAEAWRRLWEGFWAAVCDRLSVPQHAAITARFFAGESGYHLLPWNRPIDRAALAETCIGWSNWLSGRLSPASPWRDHARAQADATVTLPEWRDGAVERIATVAGEIVERDGVAGLTYRAVAGAAGVTLGVVSHKFRTSSDLLAAAFEALYRSATRTPDELAGLPALSPDRLARELAEGALTFVRGSMGSDELLLACARNPDLRTFGGHLRYLRGRTSGHYLRAMLGPDRPVRHIDAAIFSSFLVGVIAAHGLSEDREKRIAAAEGEIAHLLATLNG